MKAVCVREFGPYHGAKVEDLDDQIPGPDEVVIGVRAAEANYPDILVMQGDYQIKPPLPFSPGKAAAGVVEAVGSAVTALKPGDHVAAQVEHGAYAEKLKASAATCYPMPEDMPFTDAAALGLVYQTSHFALVERAGLAAGETVLVLGASGGIGIASVQLAKALGANRVIAGVLGAENVAVASTAGADHVIDLAMDDLRDGLRDAINDITGGLGVDVVIDPVGGATNAAALRAMAWRGRMVIIGFASGEIPTIKSNYLLVKNIAVSGLQWSDYREREPAWVANVQQELFDLYQAGKLTPHISKRFPLEGFSEALDLLKAGKVQGKVILTLDV